MASPRNCAAGLGGPGDGEGGEERSFRTKVSKKGREWRQERKERGESPQLNVESVGEGDHGGNRVLPGPGGILIDSRCEDDLKIRECDGVLENEGINELRRCGCAHHCTRSRRNGAWHI